MYNRGKAIENNDEFVILRISLSCHVMLLLDLNMWSNAAWVTDQKCYGEGNEGRGEM